ncbi:MAG: hypothetical protein JNL88_01165 [Bacteroidia bacterium]|nr:hypothetical protein [Bacteroidia bacterium]
MHQLLNGKLLCLLAGMSLFSLVSYSQSPGKQETVEYINSILGEKARMEMKAGTLFVTFYNDQGKVIREDKVQTPDLDLAITYEEEEGLLCIPCMRDQPDCVLRVLTVQKVKRTYGRLSIPVSDSKTFHALRKAFDHLIRTTSEHGYKEAVTFE